jgi:Ca2+-binding EF-hand superfamily protein
MKTCLTTLVFCLAASTAMGQFLQTPDADKAAAEAEKLKADKDKPAAGDRAAKGAGSADRRGPGGPAAAAGPGAPHGAVGPMFNPMFAALDADSDGVITTKELRKAIARLKTLDTDNDGNITLAEASPPVPPGGPMAGGWQGGQPGDQNQMIDRIMQSDKNGDGKLTAEEIPGPMAQQMIQNGDKDGDGALSKDELTQGMQAMQNRFGNMPFGFQGGPGNFPGGPGAFQGGAVGNNERQMMGEWLQWDRNGDGKLSSNEVPPQAAAMLRGGDQNNDNMIDPAELRLLIERNGERMRAAYGRAQNGQNSVGKNDKGIKSDADGKKREGRPGRDE